MEFDRVRNEEQRRIRIEQIKTAAVKLFDSEQFHEITLAKIASETSFTRGNLYKYISSKEEIYLLVTLDEARSWLTALSKVLTKEMTEDISEFSRKWAEVMYEHQRFLKLISLLFTIIERNVTLEHLVSFKKEFAQAVYELVGFMHTVFPMWNDYTVHKFIRLQMNYAIGLYPNTAPTTMQLEAAALSGFHFGFPSFIEDFSEFISYTVAYLNHTLKKPQ